MECQLTLQASEPDRFGMQRLEPFLTAAGTVILNADFFGEYEQLAFLSRQMQIPGNAEPETTLLLDAGVAGGTHISTLSGVNTTPIFDRGRIIGRSFEDPDAKYCWLGGVLPADPTAPRDVQAGQVLQTIHRALAEAGMHFRDVVRTWFYVDRILDGYGEFNRVRTAFFEQNGVISLPASTGIGAPNAAGAAVVAKVIAMLPKNSNVEIKRIQSPLQCEASAYGSSFSRAMEVRDSSTRTLYVSGTASIEPAGRTVHAGNAAKQIETTMEVVCALIEEAGMVLTDTTRAIAYFRHSEHIPLWHDYCRKRQLLPLPIILIPSDICRDDLLFEIELDAARALDCDNDSTQNLRRRQNSRSCIPLKLFSE